MQRDLKLAKAHVSSLSSITEQGKVFVGAALAAPPNRRVRSTPFSSASRIASHSGSHVLQAESISQERFFVLLSDIDQNAVCLLDQVPGVRLNATSGGKRRIITPDYLLVTESIACLVECKPPHTLKELIERHPERFDLSRALPRDLRTTEFEAETGIPLYYFSAPTDSHVLLSNLEVLNALTPVALHSVDELEGYVLKADRLSLLDLRATFGPSVIFLLRDLFIRGRIKLPVCTDFLEREVAFRVDQKYEYACHISEISVSATLSSGANLNSAVEPITHFFKDTFAKKERPDYKARKEAERRLSVVRSLNEGGSASRTKSTHYRYLAAVKKAEQAGRSPLDALTPNFSKRGGGKKTNAEVEQLMNQLIHDEYCSPTAPTITEVHNLLREFCKAKGLRTPSYNTLSRRIQEIDQFHIISSREGKKRVKSQTTRKATKKRQVAFSGPRSAFMLGQIDSTPLDIHLINSVDGSLLPPCHLTVLVDVGSRRVLSYVITVGAPDAHAAMTVLRLCALRWGRLPSSICADNGSIFWSDALETMMADFRISKEERALSQPQGGGNIIEGLFGVLLKRVINSLPGNKQRDKYYRSVYRHEMSSNYAVLDLYELAEILDAHWELPRVQEPEAAEELTRPGLRTSYGRIVKRVDKLSRYSYMKSATKRTVVQDKGVRFNHAYYWHSDFRKKKYIGRSFDIYYDPSDCRTIRLLDASGEFLVCRNSTTRGAGMLDVRHLQLFSICHPLSLSDSGKTQRARQNPSIITAARKLQAKRPPQESAEEQPLDFTALDPTERELSEALRDLPEYDIG